MSNELSLSDLYDMLLITNMYNEGGLCTQGKVQLNVEHAVEILTRLIAYETKEKV
jgi:hypothetical protein